MSLATPCPEPLSRRIPDESKRLNTAAWINNQQDETCTANIEYTRALGGTYRPPPPKRPRRPAKNAVVAIFEDVVEERESDVGQARASVGPTLLSKPARKIPGKMLVKSEELKEPAHPHPQALGDIRQGRARKPAVSQAREVTRSPIQRTAAANAGPKKEARRRTIFVPSDETTMLTIHPGANTTRRLDDTFQQPGYIAHTPTLLPEQAIDSVMEESRPAPEPRMSLAAAPKRAPLQHLVAKASNVPGVDVPGQNGGKENVPPQGGLLEVKLEKKALKPTAARDAARTKLYEPTAASQARQTVVPRNAVPLARKRPMVSQAALREQDLPSRKSIAAPRSVTSSPAAAELRTLVRSSPSNPHSNRSPHMNVSNKPTIKRGTPPKRSPGQTMSKRRLQQYPVLSEDIAQPQLYEDSWLSHQEIALTELANEIFDKAQPSGHQWQGTGITLREQMLGLYHQPAVATLHTRLRASLVYGALSRPKDMPSAPDPTHDLGLRKRFLNLWLHTYDEEALRAAAEVVVGRQVPESQSHGPGCSLAASESVLDPGKNRRALIGFLETFLVTVEDLDGSDGEADGSASKELRRWRKSILRSLMPIWLLDQAKAADLVSGCLFKRTASHKSSFSVLQALSAMRIPSIGDVTRPLRQFDYAAAHAQDPLDEVRYHIDNIATDLRDGVFLTRLVEILLFSANSSPKKHHRNGTGEATVTFQLPDATIIESLQFAKDGTPCPRLVSQHLKMPTLGRAQKVYNVQIALSALAEHGGHAEVAVADVTAYDVVDGHREKTLGLLWALLSTQGLAQLVDWNELARDIARATGDATRRNTGSLEQREGLLVSWAAAYCNKHGLQISNLTTSFADGKAYEAILEAYAAFLPTSSGQAKHRSSHPCTTVGNRLQILGCSTAFIKQFTSPQSSIPSRQTTISDLAFLASRLLPLARRHNAAITLQRAYRRRLARITITQRVALARLASDCAIVVQTQQKLMYAATVLQKAWRGILGSRIARLSADVESFQGLARGWSMRRRLRKSAVLGWSSGLARY